MQSRSMLVLTICAFLLAGCGQVAPTVWLCTFHENAGHAVLDCDKVKIVFDGVKLMLPVGQEGGGATGSLQVGGSGTNNTTLTALHHTLTSSYSDGVNSISLGNYAVKVLEQGHKLQVGEKSFTLDGNTKTIVIRDDGSAEERQPEKSD
jgi:hypothetical protein